MESMDILIPGLHGNSNITWDEPVNRTWTSRYKGRARPTGALTIVSLHKNLSTAKCERFHGMITLTSTELQAPDLVEEALDFC